MVPELSRDHRDNSDDEDDDEFECNAPGVRGGDFTDSSTESRHYSNNTGSGDIDQDDDSIEDMDNESDDTDDDSVGCGARNMLGGD